MPTLITDPQTNQRPQVRAALFTPTELRDLDWLIEGYVDDANKCDNVDDGGDRLAVLQDIRHHLKLANNILEQINGVLQCPNTQEIPEILRNIFKFVSAIYDDGFKEQARKKQLKRIRRKPARRTAKKSRRR